MDLHWSFRWGYEEDFLSNCCFKKLCVDSTPPSPVLIGLKFWFENNDFRFNSIVFINPISTGGGGGVELTQRFLKQQLLKKSSP